VVARTLAKHGLADPGRHPGAIDPVEAVLQNLSDLAAARTHAGGPTLSELCRGDKLVEWKFTLPMGLPAVGVLAAQFDQHGGDVAKAYAPRLRQLRPKQLRGYLTGFADLVARHEGRYWVVDWKSNHLGGCVADYGPAALAGSMEHHDYILQYHLYVLAWHRHLQARVRSYDYDEHFGGVCYAFLRAAQPGRSDGMFHDRPQRALVEGLDRWAKGDA
jgi:exodeoxyribonuclease V beta subunit